MNEHDAAETSLRPLPESPAPAGVVRFDVLGLDSDRELIRLLAGRLAAGDAGSARIRAAVHRAISGEPAKKGGILNALRRSPLVGADLDLNRRQ